MVQRCDLLVTRAAQLVTCAGFSHAPARGADQAALGMIEGGAVAVANGAIVDVGPSAALEPRFDAARVIDATGAVVLPGFVDPHTHLVFAGHRASEWEARMGGVPYLELLRRGGGILSTVRATRAASFTELVEGAERRARQAIAHGTTTLEIKTGYRLDEAGEIELLRVIAALSKRLPIRVVSTLLAAHVVPPEFADQRSAYLELCERLHLKARDEGLAAFVDVFCEQEAFSLAESERLLTHAKGLGFGLKLHAEQFTASGAAELAARLGAVSAEHLEALTDASLAVLAASERPPVAVLLPGVTFHLNEAQTPPARSLIEAGVPVALATDFNPGSSFTLSMPMILALAARLLHMSVAEAVVAATINAAHAVGLGASTGSLEPGKRADLIVCDVPDYRFLAYAFGSNPVTRVVAGGTLVPPAGGGVQSDSR